jgi:hypothetical protein
MQKNMPPVFLLENSASGVDEPFYGAGIYCQNYYKMSPQNDRPWAKYYGDAKTLKIV